MIINTSAVIDNLAPRQGRRIVPGRLRTTLPRMSAADSAEATVVIDASRYAVASRRFDELPLGAQIVIEPVTEGPRLELRQAYRNFGESTASAKLNFGIAFPMRSQRSLVKHYYYGYDFAQPNQSARQ